MANPLDLEPELLPFVSSEERKLLRDRALSADDEQAMLAELRRARAAWLTTLHPTDEQILAVAYQADRDHAAFGRSDRQHQEALRADWERKQKPTAEDVLKARNPAPKSNSSDRPELRPFYENLIEASWGWRPSDWSDKALDWLENQRVVGKRFESEKEAEDAYITGQRPPFPAPSEAQLSRDRIIQMRMVGLRPDPADVQKVLRDDLEYKRVLAGKLEKVKGEFLSGRQSKSKSDPKSRTTQPHAPKTDLHWQWFWGGTAVLTTILALVFWGALFVLAAVFYFVWVYRAPWFLGHEQASRRFFKAVIDLVIAMVLFFAWLLIPSPFKSRERAASNSQPSPPALSSNTSSSDKTVIEVDPAYLVGLYKKYNSAQADETVKPYLGKSTQVSGAVNDVYRQKIDGRDAASVTIRVNKADGSGLYVAWADFTDDRWVSRALIFGRGERVTVVGKIYQVAESGISLGQCEIIER